MNLSMTQLQRLVVAPSQISDQQIALRPEQQHYLSRVLRLRDGDRFIAMDGQGHWWLAVLMQNPAQADILEPIAVHTELPISVNLLVAMPKTGLDEVIRQATEMGVACIVPIISDRTVLKPSAQKVQRWQRIAQEAAEQSERQIVPQVFLPQPWTNVLQTWNKATSMVYICEARGNHPHLLTCLEREHPKQAASSSGALPQASSLTLAIGPEGGWTEAEIEQAIAAGYQPVSLGSRVLRAVTAPVVALSLVASVSEVMSAVGKND